MSSVGKKEEGRVGGAPDPVMGELEIWEVG